jgi:hypothetical protein
MWREEADALNWLAALLLLVWVSFSWPGLRRG